MSNSSYVENLPARRVVDERGKSIYRVGPKGLKVITELAARGCSVVTIAKALRMSKDSFVACRRRQPECEEAYQRGLAVEHDALVSNLRDAADEGNVVANIFLLKARHQYEEGKPLEVNVAINTGGVVVVPHRQTMEEFLLEHKAAGTLESPKRIELLERIPGERQARAERGD